jgi:hypothetical protein
LMERSYGDQTEVLVDEENAGEAATA